MNYWACQLKECYPWFQISVLRTKNNWVCFHQYAIWEQSDKLSWIITNTKKLNLSFLKRTILLEVKTEPVYIWNLYTIISNNNKKYIYIYITSSVSVAALLIYFIFFFTDNEFHLALRVQASSKSNPWPFDQWP